jgi:hypothetical protein
MYVPNKGGGFGQHGWNEIYMGEAGWVPIDATAMEIDFLDSGHIRIGELQSTQTSFNGKELEILDYKLASSDVESGTEEIFGSYLGKYKNKESGRTFEILEKDGNLLLDIPGQTTLPFLNEDEKGRWYCKMTNNMFIEFGKNGENNIDYMTLHELITMTKKGTNEHNDNNVPDELRSYLGKYLFAQLNKEFEVLYMDETLAIKDPDKERPIKLQTPDTDGGWVDEYNKNKIYFEMNDSGEVILLKLDSANKFMKLN